MFLSCYNLKEVILPESVKYIESGALAACRSLESLKLPESLLYIGGGAFANCDSLWGLQVPEKTLAAEDAFTLYESVGKGLVPVRKVIETK